MKPKIILLAVILIVVVSALGVAAKTINVGGSEDTIKMNSNNIDMNGSRVTDLVEPNDNFELDSKQYVKETSTVECPPNAVCE